MSANSGRDPERSREALSDGVSLRRLSTSAEYQACIALQRLVWGERFQECVPPTLLKIGQKIGGVTAGAFDREGKLLGFVFGLTGIREGRRAHWSHMLAVRPEVRNLGLGRRLKEYQRDLVRELGVEMIYWTFDPLEARNAHLNLNRLGARVTEYVQDMYDDDMGSDLHASMGMDRFIVAWTVGGKAESDGRPYVGRQDVERLEDAPIVSTRPSDGGVPAPAETRFPSAPLVRVEIPPEIQALEPRLRRAWRSSTREAFLSYQEHGYQVVAFYQDSKSGRCFYGIAGGKPA